MSRNYRDSLSVSRGPAAAGKGGFELVVTREASFPRVHYISLASTAKGQVPVSVDITWFARMDRAGV